MVLFCFFRKANAKSLFQPCLAHVKSLIPFQPASWLDVQECFRLKPVLPHLDRRILSTDSLFRRTSDLGPFSLALPNAVPHKPLRVRPRHGALPSDDRPEDLSSHLGFHDRQLPFRVQVRYAPCTVSARATYSVQSRVTLAAILSVKHASPHVLSHHECALQPLCLKHNYFDSANACWAGWWPTFAPVPSRILYEHDFLWAAGSVRNGSDAQLGRIFMCWYAGHVRGAAVGPD